jgi:hypothetical protein
LQPWLDHVGILVSAGSEESGEEAEAFPYAAKDLFRHQRAASPKRKVSRCSHSPRASKKSLPVLVLAALNFAQGSQSQAPCLTTNRWACLFLVWANARWLMFCEIIT